jgi:4-hydroxy-tetrahydrodipicolinate reductase
MSAIKIAVVGAKGRMGQAIIQAVLNNGDIVHSTLDAGDDLQSGLKGADVAIDFSNWQATLPLVESARANSVPLVIGTTGHTQELRQQIEQKLTGHYAVWAGNFSVGVNLLFYLTRIASDILGSEYGAELVEMHHRHKQDAPSGTAERLLEILLESRKVGRDQLRHGRQGITGARTVDEIGVHALRGGSVVGEHTVVFAGDGETIRLEHRAEDRSIFARGAVRAAHWLKSQKTPGLFRMEDVLGLHR